MLNECSTFRYLAVVSICILVLVGNCFSEQGVPAENAVVIEVDPRIELIGVIQLLSGDYPVSTDLSFPYREKVENYFAPNRSHPAVVTFRTMAKSSFSYDAPIGVMLHLGAPPELAVEYPIPEYYIQRAGGTLQLEEFLRQLREFAIDSRFMEFFHGNEPYYKELRSPFESYLSENPLAPSLEEYYGLKQAGYFVYLSQLTKGGFGPKVEVAPSFYNIYSIASPSKFENDSLFFFSNDGLKYVVWHEFAHSFVNPLTDKYWDSLSTRSDLLTPIIDSLPAWYHDWKAALNEHIVRAVTVRMVSVHFGEEQGNESLARQVEWGYAYVPEIAEKLEEYEAHRDSYRTFDDFFPSLVKLIMNLDAK